MSRRIHRACVSYTYIFLHSGKLDNPLIDGTLRDEPVDGDLASLTKTMSTIHGLSVVRRVPVMVVEDNGVRGSQVDTQTTRSSTEDEDEDIGSDGNIRRYNGYGYMGRRILFATP